MHFDRNGYKGCVCHSLPHSDSASVKGKRRGTSPLTARTMGKAGFLFLSRNCLVTTLLDKISDV